MAEEDDPFADLGETLETPPDTQDNSDSPQNKSETQSSDTADKQRNSQNANYSESHDPMTDSAFSYEAAIQRPFYARSETIEDFDAWLNYELERSLSTRGYQNIVVREMTDAILRTVVEEDMIDAVAERFEQARETATSE